MRYIATKRLRVGDGWVEPDGEFPESEVTHSLLSLGWVVDAGEPDAKPVHDGDAPAAIPSVKSLPWEGPDNGPPRHEDVPDTVVPRGSPEQVREFYAEREKQAREAEEARQAEIAALDKARLEAEAMVQKAIAEAEAARQAEAAAERG